MAYEAERRIQKAMEEDGFIPPRLGDRQHKANKTIADYIAIIRSERDQYLKLLSERDDATV